MTFSIISTYYFMSYETRGNLISSLLIWMTFISFACLIAIVITTNTWVWVNSGSWWWTEGLACCDSWGRKESDTTERLNWTELILNRNSKSRHHCLVPDFKGKSLSISLLSMMLAVGVSYMTFIMFWYIPSITTLITIFIVNECLTFSSDFSVFIKRTLWFLSVLLLIYHIYWFADVEPSLHPWDKSHLIMIFFLNHVIYC